MDVVWSVTKPENVMGISSWIKGFFVVRGGPVAPPNRHTRQNRRKEPILNRLRSKDQERPSQEAVVHRAGHTPWSGCTYENGPTPSTDLAYL
jgi:hypothetical protein